MAFFRKKKDDFNPNDAEIIEEDYTDFQKTIDEIIGTGSQDIKKIEIKLNDDSLVSMYVENGKITFATSTKNPLNLSTRLYWVDDEIAENETVQTILNTTDNYFEIYNRIYESVPSYHSKIDEIYRNYTFSVIELSKRIGIKSLFIEMMIEANTIKMIRGSNFIAISPSNIDKSLDFSEEAESRIYAAISSSDYKDVILRVNNNAILEADETRRGININEGKNDEERLIIAASEAESSLEDIYEKSSGFQWQEVLQAASNLIFSNKIEIEDLGEPEEEEFELSLREEEPEEEISLENIEEYQEEVEEDEGVELYEELLTELDSDNEPVDSGKFSIKWNLDEITAPENDDEGFFTEENDENELSIIAEVVDHKTQGLEPKISPMIEKTFKEVSDIGNDETYKVLIKNAIENDYIEHEVLRLDEIIEMRIQEYNEGRDNYEDTALQVGIESGMYSNELISEEVIQEDSKKTIDLKKELADTREKSNTRFFNIEAVESSRNIKNITRKAILKNISSNVTLLQNKYPHVKTEDIDEVISVIQSKNLGIDSVNNKALHLERDNKEILDDINPMFFEKNDFAVTNSPIFEKLATDLNIDKSVIRGSSQISITE